MSQEKRLVLCVLLIFAWVMVAPNLLQSLGLLPPRRKPPAPAQAAVDPLKAGKKPGEPNAELKPPVAQAEAAAKSVAAPGQAAPKTDEKAGKPAGEKPGLASAAPVDSSELVLGSASDKTPGGYWMEVRLEQKGAGVESVLSSRYDAEFEGRINPHLPLQIIRRDPLAPPSLSLTLSVDPVASAEGGPRAENLDRNPVGDQPNLIPPSEDLLDSVLWEVVRDDTGRIVLPLTGENPISGKAIEGQQVSFRTTASNGVVVTKTFRLWQTMDGLELELRFESPDRDRTFSYNMLGPHGIPIEGEWYTGTFREVFFGTYDQGKIKVDTHTALDVAKAREKPIDSTTLPLRFAGVENQYFATLMAPYPAPTSDDDRLDRETKAIVLHEDPKALQKADVGVRMSSKAIRVGPNLPQVHTYRVFAGPKTEEALSPYGASALLIPKEQFYPRGFLYRPVRDHADVVVHVPGHPTGCRSVRLRPRQLGGRDHPADSSRQADDVPARPQAGSHGPAIPGASALPQADSREIQGRQGEADQGDLRPVQEARRESGQRLHSGPDPVADLRGALAGPEHQRGSPARVVPLDQ